jgi:hypothetical protein
LLEALAQDGAQLGVLLAARPGGFAAMIMKAAFGDIESVGQLVLGEAGGQSLHYGVSWWGISADKMPKAFLRSRADDGGIRFPGADRAVRVAPGSPQ